MTFLVLLCSHPTWKNTVITLEVASNESHKGFILLGRDYAFSLETNVGVWKMRMNFFFKAKFAAFFERKKFWVRSVMCEFRLSDDKV